MPTWRPSDPKKSLDETWRISSHSSFGPNDDANILGRTRGQTNQYVNLDNQPVFQPGTSMRHNHTIRVKKERSENEKKSKFRGQIRRWPGVLLLLLVIAAAVYGITHQAKKSIHAKEARDNLYERNIESKRKINDSRPANDKDIISDDGQVGNPVTYDTEMKCSLPDYQSKDGRLFAVGPNGTEIPFQIKGVNWFGMETSMAIPFGLWENDLNGTSAYEIASFLARNKFNAVRLPVSIENIIKNTPPDVKTINTATNRAINIKNYMTALQSLTKALAYRGIGVLVSLHRLSNSVSGANWFDPAAGISQDDFLQAVQTLTTGLCGDDYWNIIGLDLKNEPEKAEWGTGTDADFVIGCEKIAKVMHEGCPQWLGFVEGITTNTEHSIVLDGVQMTYYDWWGGGLQGAGNKRPTFTIPNKLVWAPHYYTTAVSPQRYFYGEKTTSDYSQYEELSDDALMGRVDGTMREMFGYLVDEQKYALLLGEFAGLYTNDLHPMKTTRRTTDFTVRVLMDKNYAGGFMWSLNPESNYQYNPVNVKGAFKEGLLKDDWLQPNTEFINAFAPMDAMPDLKPFPCFPISKK